MGACFSSVKSQPSQPSAKVISTNGILREYPVPINVSQLLESEDCLCSSYFVCNSDRLYYEDYIPVLDLNVELEANQIYFVLPVSKLQQRLTASDMAALAVKASVAIQNASTKDGYRRKKARISPVLLVNRLASSENYSKINDGFQYNSNMNKPLVFDAKTVGVAGAGKLSRAGSVRKLQRFTSKRAKLAVRSFRLRLSTIHEGTDV
ncbi:uncharacterized protein LOC126695598 [Quercus robur]|uniref:uncharacterized protein LOC126695598 n=1 Tax=Quercus robur TaxID=38942 RepID=UPI002162545E|nr:uncharacterized protein LOC126695598 [Quercus robur]